MKNILVSIKVSLSRQQKDRLVEAAQGNEILFVDQSEVTEEQVQWADIIVGNPPAAYIKGSAHLELMQLASAGTDDYIKPGVLNEKTVLANATGAYGRAVSEHAFAMTLMLQKKLHLYRDNQRRNLWHDEGPVTSVGDSTVVVVGLGDIGQRYARLVHNMGAHVIGVKRRAGDCPDCVDELCLSEEMDKALAKADIVATFLPGTGGTYHTYNAERFAIMKPNAIFINCGRGSAVDSEALFEALSCGKIAAAGIDVTETEPLPADSKLWGLENLVITPHISGDFHLPDILERVVDIACANIRANLGGGEYINIVDMKTGYKK